MVHVSDVTVLSVNLDILATKKHKQLNKILGTAIAIA